PAKLGQRWCRGDHFRPTFDVCRVHMSIGGSRREARERALGLLYEADAKDTSVADVLADLPIDPDPYATAVARGVDDHRVELDELITRYAKDWTVDRMPVADRFLLRMGIYELL